MDSSGTGFGPALNAPEFDELAAVSEQPERDRRAVRVLWSQRRFIFRFTLLGLLLSVAVAFLIRPQYQSTVRLMPPDSSSDSRVGMFMQLVGGAGGLAADLLGRKSSGDVLLEILRSRTLEEQLINQFDLRKVYGAKLMMDARVTLLSHTKIIVAQKSGVISITVTDRDRERAMRLAQAYVNQLDHFVAALNTSAAHRERVFLEQRLTAVKQDLDLASRNLSQFASKNSTIDPQQQGKAMVDAAAQLQGELIAKQSELKGLAEIYTAQNVRVRSAQARVTELKRQLGILGGSADNSAEPTFGYPSIRQLPLLGATYADLYRRTKIQEAVYETLTKQYELAKVEEAKELPSVRVLDPANWPERKSWPPRRIFVIVGTFLFLFAGTLWIVGSDYWRQLDPRDARRQLADEALAGLDAARRDLAGDSAEFKSIVGRFRRHRDQAPGPISDDRNTNS